jgi:hypothetical protein
MSTGYQINDQWDNMNSSQEAKFYFKRSYKLSLSGGGGRYFVIKKWVSLR